MYKFNGFMRKPDFDEIWYDGANEVVGNDQIFNPCNSVKHLQTR